MGDAGVKIKMLRLVIGTSRYDMLWMTCLGLTSAILNLCNALNGLMCFMMCYMIRHMNRRAAPQSPLEYFGFPVGIGSQGSICNVYNGYASHLVSERVLGRTVSSL
jgi:hypothetical protein